ncbi:MAG: amidase [Acidobacteria bacterium]|nr:amidase [Acidobacteriota bacterium]
MASTDRPRRGRRAFLKQLPGAVAAGLAAPALAEGGAPAQPAVASDPAAVTADMLGSAQQVSGLSLPPTELEQARPLVERNRANIALLRAVAVPSETEPAFSFRPSGGASGSGATIPAPAVDLPELTTPAPARPARLEELAFAPVTTLAALVRERRVSSVELTRMYLDRLKHHDPVLNCVVTLMESQALAEAESADREMAAGRYRGPLHGIPYGIKDLFATKGVPTTWGAQPYASQVFDYDATVVTRLREAGAVLMAKLSTGELAVGDLWFRARTRNPWNPEKGSSGSSAGPASAAAAGLVGFAVGTETGGSIISPAATCGVVGLRPTYGRVPRTGCMTLRWTLDKAGPITRSIADAALVLQALAGPDGHDDTVGSEPFSWNGSREVRGLRIGVVTGEFDGPPDDASAEERQAWPLRKAHLDAALAVYRKGGATFVPVSLPDLPAAAVYAILNAEAGAMFDELLRSGGINELIDKGTNGRANQLRAARFIPAVDYIRAQRVRRLLSGRMNALFDGIDAFLAPSSSTSVTMTNLTGHPAAVVPAGLVDGLPMALMVTGPLWREDLVLRIAGAFESATDWHERHPALG